MTGLFKPLGKSIPEAVRAKQYGNFTTPSFVQCTGINNEKTEDFEIKVTTNTALNNLLDPTFIHYLSGKFMPLNDGSTQKLTYVQESATLVMPILNNGLNFTNRALINSLGLVSSWQEIVSGDGEGTSHLKVIVAHNDWDPQERAHKQFSIKYIVPGSKLYVKTFNLYVVERKLKISRRLVDFKMGTNMAVVVVSHVAVKLGHMIGMNPQLPVAGGSGSPHGKTGWSLTKFSPVISSPAPSSSATLLKEADTLNQHKPTKTLKGKGKAKKLTPKTSNNGKTPSEEEFEEESKAEVKPKACGRPRKDILKDAAKRMKQS